MIKNHFEIMLLDQSSFFSIPSFSEAVKEKDITIVLI